MKIESNIDVFSELSGEEEQHMREIASTPLAKPFFHEKMDCFLSTPVSKTRNVEI